MPALTWTRVGGGDVLVARDDRAIPWPATHGVSRRDDSGLARCASIRCVLDGRQRLPGARASSAAAGGEIQVPTRLTVSRIDANPDLAKIGIENIERWTRQKGYLPLRHAEWKQLIETHPWERLREMLLEESDEGQRLRSSHPFKGLVSPEERAAIHAP